MQILLEISFTFQKPKIRQSDHFLSVINFQAKITMMMIKLFIFFTFPSMPTSLCYLIRDVGMAFQTLLGAGETEAQKKTLIHPNFSAFLDLLCSYA